MRAFVVDAFTDTAFRGNPAGVVLLAAAGDTVDPAWMQSVAAELRHSETAFVSRRPDGDRDLRWFTPAVEVELCGHATLATAHVLAELGEADPFVFHTRSGPLRAQVDRDGIIAMDFPARHPVPITTPPGLAAALGVEPVAVCRAGTDVLVAVAGSDAVQAVAPDMTALAEIEYRGVIVTAAAPAGADYDFVSRFFGPRVGVDEDPVTGSAHCALGPYWAAQLGRQALSAAQLSARGGRVGVEVLGDCVQLRGRAVTVLEGMLSV